MVDVAEDGNDRGRPTRFSGSSSSWVRTTDPGPVSSSCVGAFTGNPKDWAMPDATSNSTTSLIEIMYPNRISCLMTSMGSTPIISARSATEIADGISSTGRRGRTSILAARVRGAALWVVVRFVVIGSFGTVYTVQSRSLGFPCRDLRSHCIPIVIGYATLQGLLDASLAATLPESIGRRRIRKPPAPGSLPVLSILTPSSGVETIRIRARLGPFAPHTMHVRRGTCLLAGVISVLQVRGVDYRRLHRGAACRLRRANLEAPVPQYPRRTGLRRCRRLHPG